MIKSTAGLASAMIAASVLAGCATAGYSPPPERRAADRCPTGEVWVCSDRSPSRLEREDRFPPICRCEHPGRIH